MVNCVRKLNGAIYNGHKTLKARNMKKFTEDPFIADVSSIQWCYILPEADNANILVEEWSTRFVGIKFKLLREHEGEMEDNQ